MKERLGRALRGWRTCRGTLAVLIALTAVVTAGTVAALRFAQASGASWGLALPLLIVGVAAIPATGAELAEARRREVTIARLRGLHGVRLIAFQLGEPLSAILSGAALGLVTGRMLGEVAVRRWLDLDEVPLAGRQGLYAAGVVVLLALIAVAWGGAADRGRPLADQLRTQERPRPSSTAAAFWSVLIVVAAGVALYRARQPGENDWVVLAGPALLGLALGQVSVWLVRGLARVFVRRSRTRALPGFLASRRLARAADATGTMHLLVAAGVVAILASSAAGSVSVWSDQTARLGSLTEASYRFNGATGHELLDLADKLDPDRTWLLPALVADSSDPRTRRAYVDTTRYAAVIGNALRGTGAESVTDNIAKLATVTTSKPSGNEFVLTGTGMPGRDVGVSVRLSYVSMEGEQNFVQLDQFLPRGQRLDLRAQVEGCEKGCLPLQLDYTAFPDLPPSQIEGPIPGLIVDEFSLGNQDLADLAWKVDMQDLEEPTVFGATYHQDGHLIIQPATLFRPWPQSLAATVPAESLPVFATDGGGSGERVAANLEQVQTPGGNERRAKLVGTYDDLPLDGDEGYLADLATSMRASSTVVPSARRLIIVREGVPDSMTAALRKAGGELETRADAQTALETEAGGAQLRLLRALSLACLLVALLAVLGGYARQRRAFIRDAGALRVIGVEDRVLRRAAGRETFALALTVLGVSLLGGWLAIRTLLPHLPTLQPPDGTLPLDLSPRWWLVVVTATLLGLVVALATSRSRRIDAAATTPAATARGGVE